MQWLYRNDAEADCSAAELNAWDLRVILEDKEILESVDADAPVDVSRRAEQNMPADQPGLIMRKRLLALLRTHGEQEINRTLRKGEGEGEGDRFGAPAFDTGSALPVSG